MVADSYYRLQLVDKNIIAKDLGLLNNPENIKIDLNRSEIYVQEYFKFDK